MALNPEEFDRIVTLERHADGAEPVLPETAPAPTPEAAPAAVAEVDADYNQVQLCNSYSTCRTWAQQTLGDMQSFQSDRRTLAVPSQFSSIDSQYGDGLSAGIAALNELINGMDTDNVSKIRDGFKKLEGAMLTIAKAETA